MPGQTGGGIFLSTNSGANWTAINTGLTTMDIYSLAVSGTDIYAGTDISGVWKRSLAEVVGINEISDNNNFTFYPNPSSDFVSINIGNSIKEELTINIYNVIGTLVKTETLKQNHQQINVKDLSNGIYTIEINSKDRTENHKLIIQK